jgi:hypothetical protein
MTDAELLTAFDPVECDLMLNALRREDEARARAAEQWVMRKPADAELIAAGWKSPPPPPPAEADLLRNLREAHREIGPRQWVLFSPAGDDVLLALHSREPGLLRHKVTKLWGHMWRLAKPTKESTQ